MAVIHQIDPREHPIAAGLFMQLGELRTMPYAPCSQFWYRPLPPQPTDDMPRPLAQWAAPLALDIKPPPGCFSGCANYFPAGGGIGWHTDSHRPGWRLYVFRMFGFVKADNDQSTGQMRYADRVLPERNEGAYVFETGVGCWHAVESFGHRVSAGLLITDEIAKELIG